MMLLKPHAAMPGVRVEIEVTGALLAALVKIAATAELSDEERLEIAFVRFSAARALHGAERPWSNGSA